MKKILLIGIAAVFLIFGGTALLVFFNATALVEQIQPQIEKYASRSLGTPVKLGKLSLSFATGIGLSTKEVNVGENKGNDRLSVDEVQFSFHLLPLLSGKASGTLTVKGADVKIRKTAQGIEVAGLKKGPEKEMKKKQNNPADKPNQKKQGSTTGFAVEFDSITIEDATLNLQGFTPSPLLLSKINLSTQLSLESQKILLKETVLSLMNQEIGPVSYASDSVAYSPEAGDVDLNRFSLKIAGSEIEGSSAINLSQMSGDIALNKLSLLLEEIATLSFLHPKLEAISALSPAGLISSEDMTVKLPGNGNLPEVVGSLDIEQIQIRKEDLLIQDTFSTLNLTHDGTAQIVKLTDTRSTLVKDSILSAPILCSIPSTELIFDGKKVDLSKTLIKFLQSTLTASGSFLIKKGTGAFSIEESLIKLKEAGNSLKPAQAFKLAGSLAPTLKGEFSTDGDFSIEGDIRADKVAGEAAGFNLADLDTTIDIEGTKDSITAKSSSVSFLLNQKRFSGDMSVQLRKISNIVLEHLNLDGLGGTIKGEDSFYDIPTGKFRSVLKLTSLKIPLVSEMMKSPKVTGTLDTLGMNLTGSIGPKLLSTLSGNTTAKISDSTLEKINLLQETINSLETIPFLEGKISSRIPEKFKPFIKQDSTVVKSLNLHVNLENGQAIVHTLDMLSDVFTLSLIDQRKGTISLQEQMVKLPVNIAFVGDFSQMLISKIGELKKLATEKDTIEIPVTIEGKPPVLKVRPDAKALLKSSAGGLIKEKATKLLEKKGINKDVANTIGSFLEKL